MVYYAYFNVSNRIPEAQVSLETQVEFMNSLQVSYQRVALESRFTDGQSTGRPVLDSMISALCPGDCLVVYGIDCLGPTTLSSLAKLKQIHAQGATVRSKDFLNSEEEGVNQFSFELLVRISEMETVRIQERRNQGILRAKKQGNYQHVGRKKKITPEMLQRIDEERSRGVSITQIAENLGVGRTTIYKYWRPIDRKPGD